MPLLYIVINNIYIRNILEKWRVKENNVNSK